MKNRVFHLVLEETAHVTVNLFMKENGDMDWCPQSLHIKILKLLPEVATWKEAQRNTELTAKFPSVTWLQRFQFIARSSLMYREVLGIFNY